MHNEYFLGIEVPMAAAEVLFGLRQRAQGLVRTRYGCPDCTVSHGKSPSHITLIAPFESDDGQAVEEAVNAAAAELTPFEIGLTGLDAFALDTIYARVDPAACRSLARLREELLRRLSMPADGGTYRPHVSLARKFRDEHFMSIWQGLEEVLQGTNVFPQRFLADTVTAFTKDGDEWVSCFAARRSGDTVAV